jgi:hypothetical protein
MASTKRLPTLQSSPDVDVIALQRYDKRGGCCYPSQYRPRWSEFSPPPGSVASAASTEWITAAAALKPLVGKYIHSAIPAFYFWLLALIALCILNYGLGIEAAPFVPPSFVTTVILMFLCSRHNRGIDKRIHAKCVELSAKFASIVIVFEVRNDSTENMGATCDAEKKLTEPFERHAPQEIPYLQWRAFLIRRKRKDEASAAVVSEYA